MLTILNNGVNKMIGKGFEMLRNRVKELRARYNFTQSELASRVGVTRQTIGFIEKGEFSPSITLALRISKELQMRLDELFWLEEEDMNE